MNYAVRFTISRVDSDDDFVYIGLVPEYQWKYGPPEWEIKTNVKFDWAREARRLGLVVGNVWCMLVEGDDLAYHGFNPPPDWIYLQYELDACVEKEMYERAAQLRDMVKLLKDEDEI
jgi:hypothetical protein